MNRGGWFLFSLVFLGTGLPAQVRRVPLNVQSCPAADSGMAKPRSVNGTVTGHYDGRTDSTFVTFWEVSHGSDTRISGWARFVGRPPAQSPAAQVVFLVQGNVARHLLDAAEPPPVALVLDDTIAVQMGPAVVGDYRGPRRSATVPVSILLRGYLFRLAANAEKLELELGERTIGWHRSALDNLHALYRAAACAQPSLAVL